MDMIDIINIVEKIDIVDIVITCNHRMAYLPRTKITYSLTIHSSDAMSWILAYRVAAQIISFKIMHIKV